MQAVRAGVQGRESENGFSLLIVVEAAPADLATVGPDAHDVQVRIGRIPAGPKTVPRRAVRRLVAAASIGQRLIRGQGGLLRLPERNKTPGASSRAGSAIEVGTGDGDGTGGLFQKEPGVGLDRRLNRDEAQPEAP